MRLLQRTTRRLALTEAGQAFYDSVSGSVAAIDEADTDVRERGATPRGPVRLSSPPDVGLVAESLAKFARKHPGIRLELMVTPRYVDLVTEGFDLAIRAAHHLEDSSLIARRIGSSEMILVASPGYLRRRGRPKTLAELPAHDWVLHRASQGQAQLRLTGPTGVQTVDVPGSLVADDMAFGRAAVEAGGGLALLPVHMVSEAVSAGRLEHILPAWSDGGASLFVVLPSARYVPARVALVRDFLIENLGRHLAESLARCRKSKHLAAGTRASS